MKRCLERCLVGENPLWGWWSLGSWHYYMFWIQDFNSQIFKIECDHYTKFSNNFKDLKREAITTTTMPRRVLAVEGVALLRGLL